MKIAKPARRRRSGRLVIAMRQWCECEEVKGICLHCRAADALDEKNNAFRSIIQVLDGSQPIDIPTAIMVADYGRKIGGAR